MTPDSGNLCCDPGGLEVACNEAINLFVLILCIGLEFSGLEDGEWLQGWRRP